MMNAINCRDDRQASRWKRLEASNLMLFTRSMNLGGTEKVVSQLCNSFSGVFNKIIVISDGGEESERLESSGIKQYIIPDITDKSVPAIVKIIRELRKAVHDEDISLIHSHHRMASFYSRLLFPNIPRMSTVHSVFQDKRIMTNWSYGGGKIVACGPQVKKSIIDYNGITESEVDLICNSVEPFLEEVRLIPELENLSGDCLRLCYIGRLSEIKGIRYLIAALISLGEANYRCVIVGEGELRAELEMCLQEHGLESRVSFLGRRDDVQNILSQVDVCVMPSLVEGLPMVMLESLSVGTPVLGTTVGGIPDVIVDGENGILVKSANTNELQDAIAKCIADRAWLIGMRSAAGRTYESDFSYKSWVDKYRDAYMATLNMTFGDILS